MLSGKNVLITGASRGLGLEVVRQLLKNPKSTLPQSPSVVIATCRNPDNAPELQALAAEEHNRLYVKKLDVTNFESYVGFMKEELEVSISHKVVQLFRKFEHRLRQFYKSKNFKTKYYLILAHYSAHRAECIDKQCGNIRKRGQRKCFTGRTIIENL